MRWSGRGSLVADFAALATAGLGKVHDNTFRHVAMIARRKE
jgi:hypothetical protein